jgi:thioredoxin 1
LYPLQTLEGSMSKLIPVTDATFTEQVLGADRPVLVKFEAQWCGPCKAMKPMVDEIASEYSGRLTVATVDIEDNQQTVYRLGVRAVPTVVLFKNGEVFAQKVGLPRKSDLTALIDKAIDKAVA